MSKLMRRSNGTMDVIDTAIGVAAVIVVAVIALNVLGWVAGLVFTLVKIAVFALIIAVAIRFLSGRKERY
ncbi:MAG TPA: hypothetical protein VFB78_04445 [Acidimicrobiales bacterium]|nr:hypothetical protein [Acidimicrobiales bacterium]